MHVASEAQARCATAKTVQRMMTHILEVRLAAERVDNAGSDHGSDTGDFFDIDFDHDLSHEDTCHENCIDSAFVQDSHVLHNDDVDDVVVDGVHSVARDLPVDFSFSCIDLDDDFDSGPNVLSGVG